MAVVNPSDGPTVHWVPLYRIQLEPTLYFLLLHISHDEDSCCCFALARRHHAPRYFSSSPHSNANPLENRVNLSPAFSNNITCPIRRVLSKLLSALAALFHHSPCTRAPASRRSSSGFSLSSFAFASFFPLCCSRLLMACGNGFGNYSGLSRGGFKVYLLMYYQAQSILGPCFLLPTYHGPPSSSWNHPKRLLLR